MDGKNMPLRSTSPSSPQKRKVVCSQDIATHIQNSIIIQGLHRWSSMGCEILPLVQDIIGCFGFLVKQVLFSPKLVSSAATLKLKEFPLFQVAKDCKTPALIRDQKLFESNSLDTMQLAFNTSVRYRRSVLTCDAVIWLVHPFLALPRY